MPQVARGGVRIFYEVVGEGPAILLHTGDGGDSRIWRDAGYLAGLREFSCVLMDPRGRGRSDRPDSLAAHRMEEYAEDVAAVLDAADRSVAGFWGYSSGTYVGIAFADRYPDRLRCLVGTGMLRYRDMTDLPRPKDPHAEIAEDIAAGGVVRDVEAHMAASDERFPDAIDRNVRSGDPRMHALAGVARYDWRGPRSILERARFPLLMLTGELEDRGRATEDAVAKVPGASVVRLPAVGHLGAFARSDLALPHALPFLRRHLT